MSVATKSHDSILIPSVNRNYQLHLVPLKAASSAAFRRALVPTSSFALMVRHPILSIEADSSGIMGGFGRHPKLADRNRPAPCQEDSADGLPEKLPLPSR